MSVEVVTSLANARVKAARALHMRKAREETDLFLAEGLKIIIEALDQGRAPQTLFFGRDAETPLLRRAIAETLKAGGQALEVGRDILEKISRRENPQTVVAIFAQCFVSLESIDPSSSRCFVALEGVRDPGNLGTVVRTADAAGCGGVILIAETVDPFSVESVRATMGSIFAVPIVRCSRAQFLEWRLSWPGSVVGALLTAKVDYREANYRDPALLVMGAEQSGLTAEVAAACDVNVKIPMRGRADSLNLAVATGVMIYTLTH